MCFLGLAIILLVWRADSGTESGILPLNHPPASKSTFQSLFAGNCNKFETNSVSAVCADNLREVEGKSKSKPKPKGAITESEVRQALADWGNGLVSVAQAAPADRPAVATNVINAAYNYEDGIVLFKPTLAAVAPFRTTFEGALSYFVGGNAAFTEDGSGFAAKGWTGVDFEVDGRIFPGEQALVMGNKILKVTGQPDTIAHFSMGFVRDKKTGKPMINLHHSSLPFEA